MTEGGGSTKLGRWTAAGMAGAAINGVFAFLLIIVVTRGLGAAGSGVFFVSVAVVTLLAGVAGLGVDTGLLFSIPALITKGNQRSIGRELVVALVPVVALGMVGAVAMWVAAEPLAQWIGGSGTDTETAADCLRAMALIMPFVPLFEVLLGATRALDDIKTSVVVDKIVRPVIQPVLVGLAIAVDAPLPVVCVAWGAFYPVGMVIAAVRTAALRRRTIPEQPGWAAAEPAVGSGPAPYGPLGREFWRYTGPRSVARICQVIIQRIDVIVVAGILSATEAGVYASVSRLVSTGLFFNVAIQQATQTRLSFQLATHDRDAARRTYRLSTAWLVLMAWPFYLVMLVFAPTVLELLFGSGFAQGASALRILSATMLVATACGPIDVVLLMSGRSMLSLANLVIALILNIGLNLLLVPRIGISGAAIAWLAAILATNLLPLAEVWMILRIQPWSRPWRLACGGVAVMVLGPCFVMLAVLGQGTAALLAGAAAAACCYAASAGVAADAFASARSLWWSGARPPTAGSGNFVGPSLSPARRR